VSVPLGKAKENPLLIIGFFLPLSLDPARSFALEMSSLTDWSNWRIPNSWSDLGWSWAPRANWTWRNSTSWRRRLQRGKTLYFFKMVFITWKYSFESTAQFINLKVPSA